MTPKLLALAKVCSVLMNIRAICQCVGVSSRKGEHFPFLDKNGAHKNIACLGVVVWPDLGPVQDHLLGELEAAGLVFLAAVAEGAHQRGVDDLAVDVVVLRDVGHPGDRVQAAVVRHELSLAQIREDGACKTHTYTRTSIR